jgi:hypothetical protein
MLENLMHHHQQQSQGGNSANLCGAVFDLVAGATVATVKVGTTWTLTDSRCMPMANGWMECRISGVVTSANYIRAITYLRNAHPTPREQGCTRSLAAFSPRSACPCLRARPFVAVDNPSKPFCSCSTPARRSYREIAAASTVTLAPSEDCALRTPGAVGNGVGNSAPGVPLVTLPNKMRGRVNVSF